MPLHEVVVVLSTDDEDDLDATSTRRKPSQKQGERVPATATKKDIHQTHVSLSEGTTADEADGPPKKRVKHVESSLVLEVWSDDDGEDVGAAAYKRFKARKPEARKRAIASTRKAKAIDAKYQARERDGGTGVGKKTSNKPAKKEKIYDAPASDEELMEWTMPEHVQKRRAVFDRRYERLQEGGLYLAPTYNDVSFSDEEGDRLQHIKEKPYFPGTKTSAPYKDIQLPYSAGLVPAPIAQYLRDYQVKGAAFLHELFVYQKGGILGDDMGLGKTIQVIAFLTAAYGKSGDERDRKRMRKMKRAKKKYPRTLIICPGSLMENWKDELDRWGWWHADIYHGSRAQKREALASAENGTSEIMITTYSSYRQNCEAINLVQWDCVVADECHLIKERKAAITQAMAEVNALCRIGLTGTAIQNKYEELWTLLNWTNPGRFGPISTWKVSICEPLKLGQSHNASVDQLSRARKTAKSLVENLLPQFFLRRMKTLIQDQLPKKSDRVVFCPLTEAQTDAYCNFIDCEMVRTIKESGNMCGCGSGKKSGWCCNALLEDDTPWQHRVFPAMQTLQKLANHIALLIPQPHDSEDRQDKDRQYLEIALPQQHKDLENRGEQISIQANVEFCGKWLILKKLLKFWEGQRDNKVLIFSHTVRLLKMLQRLLDHSDFNYSYLDGSMPYADRYKAVQSFNTDPTQFAFLISTRAGGVGLNITSANKVVIMDPNWNPAYDLQAQDRAYRIGQTKDVEVFRLVSQGTIEEVVYARQIYKQQQANIAYNATHERRYFQGIQHRKDQKGEIFGLQNLFAYEGENIKLRDIVNKTNVAESKMGLLIADLQTDDSQLSQADDDESATEEDLFKKENSAMSQLAAVVAGEFDNPNKKHKIPSTTASLWDESNATPNDTKRHDPVQAILASAGVSYTHENSEVIGSSRVEAHLSKRAEEATQGTMKNPQARVFTAESQTQGKGDGNREYDDGRLRQLHKPPEAVKRRQFCNMAKYFGYADGVDGVVEFALFVENTTQAKRRDMLHNFYTARRRELVSDETAGRKRDMKHDTVRRKVERSPTSMNVKKEGHNVAKKEENSGIKEEGRDMPKKEESDTEDDEL